MIKQMMEMCKDIFPCVAYAAGNTPTYAGGQIGFLLCSSLPVYFIFYYYAMLWFHLMLHYGYHSVMQANKYV